MRGVESAGILNSEYFGDNLEHVWLDDLANYVAACNADWFGLRAMPLNITADLFEKLSKCRR